jgi:hypothetical protein
MATPEFLKGIGPAYFAFALAEDEVEREKQILALNTSVEQLERLVHGHADESNRAVFEVTVRDIICDENLLSAIMALNPSK